MVNHTSVVSGAERALLDLLDALPAGVDAVVQCPPGALAEHVRRRGVPWVTVPALSATLKLDPQRLLRVPAELAAGALAVRRAARQAGADVVHANSTRAGLLAVGARLLGGPPVVVTVHDRVQSSGPTRVVGRILQRGAAALIAISGAVRDDLTRLGPGPPVHVLYNPIDLDRFDSARTTPEEARRQLGLDLDAPVLALVGQITPWKGQEEAIRALASVRERGFDARLLLVGEVKFARRETTFDNVTYERSLRRLITTLGLRDDVRWCGERENVPVILQAVDVALVPSWDEPLGRSVLEAMAAGRAVVATSVGGPAEVVDHDVTGVLVAPRQPGRWAEAIAGLLADPERRARLGERARVQAQEFDRATYARRVLDVYTTATSAAA